MFKQNNNEKKKIMSCLVHSKLLFFLGSQDVIMSFIYCVSIPNICGVVYLYGNSLVGRGQTNSERENK